MAIRGKKYKQAAEHVDSRKFYSWEGAVKLLQEAPKRNFDETVEFSGWELNLGVSFTASLRGTFGYTSTMQGPRIQKVVVSSRRLPCWKTWKWAPLTEKIKKK